VCLHANRIRHHVGVVHPNGARIRVHRSRQHSKRCGLARPVRSQKPDHRPLARAEADIPNSLNVVKLLAQAPDSIMADRLRYSSKKMEAGAAIVNTPGPDL